MALLPGFTTPVQDAQHTFRQLLTALSQPGQQQVLTVSLTPPTGLTPACAAACLTLLDLETTVWLSPALSDAVALWLAFHTGGAKAVAPSSADFAVLPLNRPPDPLTSLLDSFSLGTPADPEAACTLLLQVPELQGGQPVQLTGPGLRQATAIAPQLPPDFWPWWSHNHGQYPLGVDVFLFSETAVMGLPRSVKAAVI